MIGFAALAYVRAQGDSPATLSAYPDDCDVILTLNLLEARKALAEVSWVIKEFCGMQIDEQLVLDWLQSAFDDPSAMAGETTIVDLKSDILTWIGRDMSIGVDYDTEALMAYFESRAESVSEYPIPQISVAQSYEDIINYVMCAVSCRDAGGVEPFLDKLECIIRGEDLDPVTVTIAEHEWTCAAFGQLMGLFGVVEGRFIAFFAPLPKVIPNLERIVGILRSGEGSIISSPGYKLLTEEVGEGGLLSVISTTALSVPPGQLAGVGGGLEAWGQPKASPPSEASKLSEVAERSEACGSSEAGGSSEVCGSPEAGESPEVDGSSEVCGSPEAGESPGASGSPSIGQLFEEIRSPSLVRIFVDHRGLRIRAAGVLADDQVLKGANVLGFSLDPLVLKDTSAMVPEYTVGFVQIGSVYEYWSIGKALLESFPTSSADELSDILAFMDILMSHFAGDTHIALTGDSARPMIAVTSRVASGEMLVSHLEMLATQSTPGLQIHFSDHGGELVKALWVHQEAGYLPVVSYCLVDDLLVVSTMEPAVRLTIDTIRGTVPSVEQKPVIARLREAMDGGGLYLLYVDVGALVQFLQPLALRFTSAQAEVIQAIDRVFEHMSGYVKVRNNLLSGELEISLIPQPELNPLREFNSLPERDPAAVVTTTEETAED
jgi:hypothetical protein